MFVVGRLLSAFAGVTDIVLQLLLVVVLINALLSWVRPDPDNPIVMFLDRVSDAVCGPVRRLFPTVIGGFDFAPFIVMLVIYFLREFAVGSLRDLAIRMG
jgi:YggT family protein